MAGWKLVQFPLQPQGNEERSCTELREMRRADENKTWASEKVFAHPERVLDFMQKMKTKGGFHPPSEKINPP